MNKLNIKRAQEEVLKQAIEEDKVYCMDCKYIYGYRNGGRLRKESDCKYPGNIVRTTNTYWDTIYNSKKYKIKPCDQNSSNDCKWFKKGNGIFI